MVGVGGGEVVEVWVDLIQVDGEGSRWEDGRHTAWGLLKSLWVACVRLVSSCFEEKANNLNVFRAVFEHDFSLLCEAPLQGWVFRGEIESSFASCVYLHKGVARSNLWCLLAFVECIKWDQWLKPECSPWREARCWKNTGDSNAKAYKQQTNKTFEFRSFQAKLFLNVCWEALQLPRKPVANHLFPCSLKVCSK